MTYEWPCSKRKPHEAHSEETSDGIFMLDCPGVRAHPNTMIGREPAPVAHLREWCEACTSYHDGECRD